MLCLMALFWACWRGRARVELARLEIIRREQQTKHCANFMLPRKANQERVCSGISLMPGRICGVA